MGFLLFLIAYVLYLPLTMINFCLVWKKGYFRDSALTLDKLANREFRTLWNKTLIIDTGYPFGDIEESISGVLGKNQRDNTLSSTGKCLAFVLDKIDRNHCKNSITELA